MTKAILFSLLSLLALTACAAPTPTLPALPAVSIQEAQRQIDAATNAAATSTQAVAETQSAMSLGMTATVGYAEAQALAAGLALSSLQTSEAATAVAAATQTATAVVPITETYQAQSGQATNVKIANLIQDEQTTQTRSNAFFDALLDFVKVILFAVGGMVTIALIGFGVHRFIVHITPSFPPFIVGTRRALATPIERIAIIEGQVEEMPMDPDMDAYRAWRIFVGDVAHAAALVGSWSINALSTREGGAGVAGEDAIEQARNIAVEIGALVDYRSRRGYDWAEGWGLIELRRALGDGRDFTLPRYDDNTPIYPPRADFSRCNAMQRKAKRPERAPVAP